ncbi:glycosyltransferase [Candidatus Sumerlaeota bacterium]|nr:glycosyltransferase [Candidatus Sumerlaeota bacterium]
MAELICRLPRNRYRQSLVLLQGGGPLLKKVRSAGCDVIELGYQMRYRWYDPRSYLAMWRALRKFVHHLRYFRPHILHAQLYWANILSVVAGKIARIPIIITSRLQLSDYKQGRPLLQRIENIANRFTTAVFANSEAVKRDCLAHEKLDEAKIRMIHNGVVIEDFDMIDPSRQRLEFDIKEGQIVITVIANLHPYKGHEDLINAVGELIHRFPNIQVLLPGRDQGMQTRLAEWIDKLSLNRHIRLLGERQDIPEILAISSIVVHPSHQEGFSNSILEGMIAGKPIVATNVGGNPEAVVHGVNGLIVPPKNPKELARALKLLIKDSKLRHDMGMASRERIQSEFSMFKMVRLFEQWYEDLINANLS